MRLSILFDRVITIAGKVYPVELLIKNDEKVTRRVIPFIEVEVKGKETLLKVLDALEMAPGQDAKLRVEIKMPDIEGKGILRCTIEEDGKELVSSEVPIAILQKKISPLKVVFVWHHHQPPNYLPDGTLHSEWAFYHVHSGNFEMFGNKGPYSIHIDLHERHKDLKDVDNISPSLLEQWEKAVREGYKIGNNIVSKDSPKIKEINRVLNRFKELIKEGKIEPLTTMYAHSIQGFLLRLFRSNGMGEFIKRLLEWEWELGIEISERILGIRPKGGWTPEMFWDMELTEIYHKLGIRYTILCEQHFERAGGEKRTIYEPYRISDPITDSFVIVFFRDRQLSDWISFKVNYSLKEEAEKGARSFILALYDRYLKAAGGTCVIALDGENWMILPQIRRYSAYFLDKVWDFLEKSEGAFMVTTLSDVLRSYNDFKTLTYVPTGSWINLSDSQWTEGVKSELWTYAIDRTRWVAAYYYSIPDNYKDRMLRDKESPLYKAFKAIAIALDSDYYWYGDVKSQQVVIKRWADEAYKIASRQLNKIKIHSLSRLNDLVEVTLENGLNHPVSVTVEFSSDSGDRSVEEKLVLPPNSREKAYAPVSGKRIRVTLKTPPVELSRIEG